MRVVFKMGVIGWGFGQGTLAAHSRMRVVPHRKRNCEENTGRNPLATAFPLRTIIDGKDGQNQGKQA